MPVLMPPWSVHELPLVHLSQVCIPSSYLLHTHIVAYNECLPLALTYTSRPISCKIAHTHTHTCACSFLFLLSSWQFCSSQFLACFAQCESKYCGKSCFMVMISGVTGTAGAENIAAELKVAPAPSSLRVRLMSVFCRSIAAANAFPYTLQCIFDCIYGILPLYSSTHCVFSMVMTYGQLTAYLIR